MKIGDLAITHLGNIVLVVDIGDNWADIIFSSNGNFRGGFPKVWLRRLK